MKNLTFGRYVPYDSFFHRLDPRTKLVAMMILLVAIFIPAGFIGYAVIGVLLIGCILIAHLTITTVLQSLKPMLFMLLFLLVINCLTVKTGMVWLTIGSFMIYSDAVINTLYIVVRLFLMIMITTLLTATTKPMDMTLGLEDLMAPLQAIKLPTHEIAMMISLALRFIPTLIDESQRILKAQASRGVDMENGSFKEKITAILSLIVPLFVSSFQRADDLADAMEARGYVVGAKRIRYKKLQMKTADWLTIAAVTLILAGLIVVPRLMA